MPACFRESTCCIAVIETGSFVRAAEALGLSDSEVSRAVARLEARLGVRLLQRTTRSLRLTDEGGRFYAEAAPLLAQGARKTTTVAARSAATGRLSIDVEGGVPWRGSQHAMA
jgi:DNA-binding transcriptional LysR family regulator